MQPLALVGCDHNFAQQGPANLAVRAGEKDESHFDPRYFANGVQWQLPDLLQSEIHYLLAREAFESDGRLVANATVGGKLEIFQRMSLEAFLAGVTAEGIDTPERANAWLTELRHTLRDSDGLRGKQVMFPIRAALTGSLRGPCLGIITSRIFCGGRCSRSCMISSEVRVSSAPVGSSARSNPGSLTRARAMAARCC